jgi:hypothetical protein
MCDSQIRRGPSRRAFLAAVPMALAGWASSPLHLFASTRPDWDPGNHPEPRPGIDASGVISAEALRADGYGDEVVEVFDMVRQIPQVADGLACYCGCMLLGNRSLLTCYYEGGMARGCHICQGEGRLAYRRWKEGQTLEQVRRAIDARFDR